MTDTTHQFTNRGLQVTVNFFAFHKSIDHTNVFFPCSNHQRSYSILYCLKTSNTRTIQNKHFWSKMTDKNTHQFTNLVLQVTVNFFAFHKSIDNTKMSLQCSIHQWSKSILYCLNTKHTNHSKHFCSFENIRQKKYPSIYTPCPARYSQFLCIA